MDVLGDMISFFPSWFIWVAFTGITILWYLTKRPDYWKHVGIPYVNPLPILGSMGTLFANSQVDIEMKRYNEKGRLYGTYEGSRPCLTVADPDVIKDIYVKDFPFFTSRRELILGDRIVDNMLQNLLGEKWKQVRSIITPTFSTGKIKKMTSIFIDSAKDLVQTLRSVAENGKPLNIKRAFGAYTMDVVISTAFGTKIDSYNDPNNPLAIAARAQHNRTIPWRFMLYFIFPGLMKRFSISIFPPGTYDIFENTILKIIEERKRSGKKRNDFLQLLIDAAKESGKEEEDENENDATKEMGHEEGNEQIFKPYRRSYTLSNDEMIAQCIVFLSTGYNIISSVLSFAAYELALNPDVQERLIAEIDETVREQGELNYDAVYGMKYLGNVVSETLRKYPPGFRGERRADEDYVIKAYNITVPKGMIVQIPVYAIHHDPQHYPDPEKFDPYRFAPEQRSARHPFTYLPFGAGPRNCIAMRFALMQVKVCLAYILRHCRFTKCSETQVPIQFFRGQVVLVPKDVTLKVEMRSDAETRSL